MKTVLAVVLVLAAIFVGGGFLLPSTYAIERSTSIAAGPDQIAPYVQDLKRWQDWTIWNSTDNPEFESSYAGPESGTGAEMSWTEGTSGTGSLKIAKLGAHGGIEYGFTMEYAMIGEASGTGSIELQPTGESTEVRWKEEFTTDEMLGRWMGLFSDVAMGDMLETSLDKLKSKAESSGS